MTQICLDLSPYLNAVCASPPLEPGAGVVNAWGNSFPLEEIAFGRRIVLNGVRFDLPAKKDNGPDHIECLGQCISVSMEAKAGPFEIIHVLGFGELGNQALDLTAEDVSGTTVRISVELGNWLRPANEPHRPSAWRASRLRYAAGYDLDFLQPAITAPAARLPKAVNMVRLKLGANPLAHVIAVTLSEV